MDWVFVWPGATFVAVTLAALLVRELALRTLGRWLRSAEGPSPVLEIVRVPSVLWCFVAGIAAAIQVAALPPQAAQVLNLALLAAIIVSITVTVASVVGVAIVRAGARRALGGAVTGLAQTSARGAVFVVGGLILLGALGVEITPLLTALGVGGLAVALALQDTLGNLFAGMHLLADKPIRVGDYVKIGDGIEGFVVDVGWRSTRVRLLQNNVVIVPNSTVAKSTIINYELPEPRMSLLIRVGVDYASDPDVVERALLEEANGAVGEVPGLLGEPAPSVRFIPGFGDSSLDFTLVCQVASFVDQYLVQHELRKRILRRFRADGIAIPFPQRVVHVTGNGAPLAAPEGGAHPA
ncbi:MAG: mechanosensitive ion channel family protein [Chloroflexota bacterium]